MINLKPISLICGLVIVMPTFAIAYDDQVTHPEITKMAVGSISGLDVYLKSTLGLVKGIDSRFPSDSPDPNKSVLELLKKGSTDEDKEPCRRANHMHNPMNDIPWNLSYMSDDPWWSSQGCPSLGWGRRYSNITWATGY